MMCQRKEVKEKTQAAGSIATARAFHLPGVFAARDKFSQWLELERRLQLVRWAVVKAEREGKAARPRSGLKLCQIMCRVGLVLLRCRLSCSIWKRVHCQFHLVRL